MGIIGASLSEPHVVRVTAKFLVCRRTFGRKTFAASIRIRALILHLYGDNLAASMGITRGITTKTSLTDSEARRQEKLRRRRERDRQRRAKKIAEQREERFVRLREREIEQEYQTL